MRRLSDSLVRVATAGTLEKRPPEDRVVRREPPRLSLVVGLPEIAVAREPDAERRRIVGDVTVLPGAERIAVDDDRRLATKSLVVHVCRRREDVGARSGRARVPPVAA